MRPLLLVLGLLSLLSMMAWAMAWAKDDADKTPKTEHASPAAESAVEHPVERPAAVVLTSETESGCLADQAAVEDLRKQRERLQAKQNELNAKESELKAREQALNDELKRLEDARDQISKIEGARKKENDERVSKLVETFETMSPKASAQLLASLEDSLAIAAMARMSTPKLAKVMNIMEPKRASRLTELLAGVVRAKNVTAVSNDAAVTTNQNEGR